MEWLHLLADPGRMIMFSAEVYREILAGYNRDAIVAILVAVVAGAWLLALVLQGRRQAAMPVYLVLAAMWAWLGIKFHATHFAGVNLAASWLAAGALLQAVALVQFAVTDGRAATVGGAAESPAGTVWLVAAMAFGPAMGFAATDFDSVGYFGTAPHTLGFATAGVLLLSDRAPWLRCLPAALLGVIDAVTAALIAERAIATAWTLLAMTLAGVAWRRARA